MNSYTLGANSTFITKTQATVRGPTVATLRAIEDVLSQARIPMSRFQIRKELGDRIGDPLLNDALDYMADHEMVYDEGPGGKVSWIRATAGGRSGGRPRQVYTARRTMKAMMDYQVVVEYDPESGHYTATVLGIPAIVVDAKTERSALKMAKQAIAFALEEERASTPPGRRPARTRLRAKVVTVNV